MGTGTVTDGAVGVDWNENCPICGEKRGKNCQNKTSFLECPNKGNGCKNKVSDDHRACRGYLAGHVGFGSYLGPNILVHTYDIPKEAKCPTKDSLIDRIRNKKEDKEIDKGSHPLYVDQNSIQAHHLICSEFMRDEDDKWRNVCKITGYNVNCQLNGIYLPALMKLACYLKMPRHAGSHYIGRGDVEIDKKRILKSYVDAIEIELNNILSGFSFKETRKKCEPETATKIVVKMNALSEKICKNIKEFNWGIAWDSMNYAPVKKISPRIGCANARNLSEKRNKILDSLGDELKEKGLIPQGLTTGKDWKPKDFRDMDTIQEELNKKEEDKQKALCCTTQKDHAEEYFTILSSKTKKFKFEVGH